VAPVIVIAGGLFWTRISDKLSTSELFTSLSLIAIISEPFARLLVYISFCVGGYAGMRRIEDYLLLEEHLDTRNDCGEAAHNMPTLGEAFELEQVQSVGKFTHSGGPYGVKLVHATFNGRNRESPVLRDVSLKFEVGKVNMIVGPVGCGKTALLKAIIGETKLNDGSVVLGSGSVGYCAQTPWLQNISIRDNIVAQSEWNSSWYQQILKACDLDQDVQKLAQGDKTLVGSGGCGLSGGQKHRVVSSYKTANRRLLFAYFLMTLTGACPSTLLAVTRHYSR
jgi:ABC-type multidrug transport system fused ATPase/permease subunit